MKWEDIEVKEFGEFKNIRLGGHIVKIINAYEDDTLTFRPRLNLVIDIAEGEDKDYFKAQFDNDNRSDKRWSKAGIYSVMIDKDEKSLPYYKGLVTAIENSNNIEIEMTDDVENNKFTFDYKRIIGKKFGAIYGLEEYEGDDGKIKLARKIRFVRSLKDGVDITGSEIPKVKTLRNGYVDYDDYMEARETETTSNEVGIEVRDEDLPF